MKYLILICSLCFFSCQVQKKQNTKDEASLKEQLQLTNSNWERLRKEVNLDYEVISSWLPNRGVRGRYALAKEYMSIDVLEKIIGEPAFLKGPHSSGLDVNSHKSFGHYNAKFVQKLHEKLKVLYRDKTFVQNMQPVYDKELKNYLRVYYLSYSVAANKKEIIEEYQQLLQEAQDKTERVFLSAPSSFLQEKFRGFAENMEGELDVYEGFTCPGFWVRRCIDGTADDFYALLLTTMYTFDKEYMPQ